MPAHKPRAPLTAASERRLSLRARSILDGAVRSLYLDKHNITIATGLLLRVAEHTGETANCLMTRLRIDPVRRCLITRCGQQIECARGDKPPPVIRRFLAINKKDNAACILGNGCTCTERGQRLRCKDYWRTPITAGELGVGDGRGALDATKPITKERAKRSCVKGDRCHCRKYNERHRCGNWQSVDPMAHDIGSSAPPWCGDDTQEGVDHAPLTS